MRLKLAGAAALALVVAGCGYNREDRVTGGAAAGAATGAAIGLVGGPPGVLAGAAIGGVAGGVTGAATTPDEVNLGRPVWRDGEARRRVRRVAAAGDSGGRVGSADVRRQQEDLAARGLYSGPIDGIMGPQTRAAMARSGTGGSGATGGGTGATGGTGMDPARRDTTLPPPSGMPMNTMPPPAGTTR